VTSMVTEFPDEENWYVNPLVKLPCAACVIVPEHGGWAWMFCKNEDNNTRIVKANFRGLKIASVLPANTFRFLKAFEVHD